MPTFQFQKQQMAANESRVSDEATVPAGLVEATMELDMNAAEMKDPSTDALGILEFFDEAEQNWRLIASTRLIGNPANSGANVPFVTVNQSTLNQLIGKLIRGRIEARSAGNYGATFRWN